MWSVVEWQDSHVGTVRSRHRTRAAAEKARDQRVARIQGRFGASACPSLSVIHETMMRVGWRVHACIPKTADARSMFNGKGNP